MLLKQGVGLEVLQTKKFKDIGKNKNKQGGKICLLSCLFFYVKY